MIPLSFAQRRLWFLAQLEGPSASYNQPSVVRLTGELDPQALELALLDVLDRHEVLRTVFPETPDGEPYQRIIPTAETGFHLPILPVPADAADVAVLDVTRRPFDLGTEIPLRATLLTESPGAYLLVLTVHHIASDAWSLGLLARDLSTAYQARIGGTAPDWKPLPVQYADYALWQRDLLQEDVGDGLLHRQIAHWRTALAGMPEELTLPTDRGRPAVPGSHGHRAELELSAETHLRLSAWARDHNATMFMVLQTCVAVLLSRLGAGTDIPLGSAIAGRTDEALDELVGFFVNTLVTRIDLTGDPRAGELLTRVRDADIRGYAHQDVPFERLVEDLAPRRSPSRHPLFQVMVGLQNPTDRPLDLPGVRATGVTAPAGVAKFDLEVSLTESFGVSGVPAGLRGWLLGTADLFDAATVRTLTDRLARVIDAIAQAPEARVSTVDV
ncbi:condensation domain-containing protein, partial [Polymorphospora rubra]